MKSPIWCLMLLLGMLLTHCSYSQKNKPVMSEEKNTPIMQPHDSGKVQLSNEEWKKRLTPEQYRIAREKGTERPWTSPLETEKRPGTYQCAACGNPLFVSDTKFDSGCGWPSFFEPVTKTSVRYETDKSHGMIRTEVLCGRCDAHLGHVFEDGPPPTGLRFCMNGTILEFKEQK